MPHLDRDGVRLHFEVHGSGEAILLSHGYSATSSMWDPQVAALAPRYRVVTWDLRGHGASDSPDDPSLYSHELAVADMAALLDHLGIDGAVIAGLSLGGYLSLAFHARFAERTRALVLMDTGPGFKSDEARERWNATAERTARGFEEQGLAALPARREVSAGRHRSALGLARAARGLLAQRDDTVIRSLPTVAVPTLLLVGADDTPFLAAAEYMASKIPRARHVVVPGAGHAANLDQPEAVNRELLEFLAAVETGLDPGRAERDGGSQGVSGRAPGAGLENLRQIDKVDLAAKLELFSETWNPRIVAELNGQHVKLVKLLGEFVWHHHEHEDELFLVLAGRLQMQLRDRTIELLPGQMLVVPRGVEHRPVAAEEVHVLLFEPASTLNTGNVRNERTVAAPARL